MLGSSFCRNPVGNLQKRRPALAINSGCGYLAVPGVLVVNAV